MNLWWSRHIIGYCERHWLNMDLNSDIRWPRLVIIMPTWNITIFESHSSRTYTNNVRQGKKKTSEMWWQSFHNKEESIPIFAFDIMQTWLNLHRLLGASLINDSFALTTHGCKLPRAFVFDKARNWLRRRNCIGLGAFSSWLFQTNSHDTFDNHDVWDTQAHHDHCVPMSLL